MSGTLFQIQPRTDRTVSLAAAGSQEVIMGERAIDTTGWVSGCLVVLFHAKALGSTTATAIIKCHNTFFEPAEPTVLWAGTSASPIATVTIPNADTAPNYYVQAFGAPLGPYLRCSFTHSQGANTGSCTWTTTIYIVGRTA